MILLTYNHLQPCTSLAQDTRELYLLQLQRGHAHFTASVAYDAPHRSLRLSDVCHVQLSQSGPREQLKFSTLPLAVHADAFRRRCHAIERRASNLCALRELHRQVPRVELSWTGACHTPLLHVLLIPWQHAELRSSVARKRRSSSACF